MADYNLGTASGKITVDGSGAARGFEIAQTAGNAFFSALQSQIDDVQTYGKRLAAVGAAGVAGFGLAVKTASTFEAQMSAVKAVSNATDQEFKALRETALDLGASTQFSASEAALALEELVKAGISVEDTLNGAASATVGLAAAGGTSLPEAATIAANAMNQFNLAGKDVVGVADLLAGAANVSAADVSTLGSSLSQVGAVANTAGLSLDDTVIALGQLADAGINGSDAGTSLKTMLLNLIPTTDEQARKFEEMNLMAFNGQKAMQALSNKGIYPASKSFGDVNKAVADYLVQTRGLKEGTKKLSDETSRFMIKNGVMANQFFDQEGQIKSLGEIQGVLSNSLKDLSQEQKLATLETLFGTDAMRASAIFAKNGAEGYKEFADAVGETSAADVAKTRMDNLSGAVEELSGAFETLKIKIAAPLMKPITMLVQGFTKLVAWVGNLPGPVLAVLSVIGALAAAFALITGIAIALLPVLIGLVANFVAMYIVRTLAGPILALGKALIFQRSAAAGAAAANAAFATSVSRVARFSKVAAASMKLLGLAVRIVALAFSPWGLIIAAAIAAIVLLYKNFAPFRNLVDGIASAIRGKFLGALSAVTGAVGKFREFLGQLAERFRNDVMPVIREVAGGLLARLMLRISDVVSNLYQLRNAAKTMVAALGLASGSPIGEKMSEWADKAKEWAGMVMPLLAQFANFFVSSILPILVRVAGFFGGIFIDTIRTAISGIIQAITGFVTMLTGVINIVKGIFTGNWALIWQGMKQVAQGALQALIGVVRTYFAVGVLKLFKLGLSLIRSAVAAGFGLLKGIVSGALRAVVSAASRGISGIGTAIGRGVGLAKSAMSKVKGAITGAVSGFGDLLVHAGKELMRGLGRGIAALASKPVDAVKAVAGKIRGLLPSSPVKEGPLKSWNRGRAGKKLMEMLAGGIRDERNLVVGAMDYVVGSIKQPEAVMSIDTIAGSAELLDTLTKMQVEAAHVSTTVAAPVAARLAASSSTSSDPVSTGTTTTTVTMDGMTIEGELELRDGAAYIKGKVVEVNDSDDTFESQISRQGPKNRSDED